MMLLMTVRRMKLILDRGEIQDYSLEGSDGRHLSEMTVGITGAG
ncbi:alpha-keto acid dehydrogenase [Cutibacterium acnes]|nr:alpha-keto acid dehydrogenase [Cutibacterium acnes]